MKDCKASVILGLFIAIGLIGAGYQVSNTVYKAKLASNIVSVKGFSERNVKADKALWRIDSTIIGDDISELYEKSHNNEVTIITFLTKNGIKKEDINENINVTDLMANQFRNKDALANGGRYIIKNAISINSNNVDVIEKATHQISELIKQGFVLSGNSVQYNFTNLNSIKAEMLKEATQNARNAAEQFASDSGSKVGTIQSANQGLFSISSLSNQDDESGNDWEGKQMEKGQISKKVRVVTTVNYYLDK